MSDDAVIEKFRLRAVTPSNGYYVRQAEETMKALQKENFNLKLKIYFLESKQGIKPTMPTDATNICNKEYMDLYLENETLKSELNEKKVLMSNALEVIEMLENQKKELLTSVNENIKRIEALKARFKNGKRKIPKKHGKLSTDTQNNSSLIQEELRAFKSQNSDLFARINDLKKENLSKCALIEKLSSDKLKLHEQYQQLEKSVEEKNNIIRSLKEKIKEKSCDVDTAEMREEFELLKRKNVELSSKCTKFERESSDYQRIINEQIEIMKALNRTIEAKNDEIDDYRSKINFLSNTQFIQDEKINLNDIDTEKENNQKFPFHNPLFGSFHSLYR